MRARGEGVLVVAAAAAAVEEAAWAKEKAMRLARRAVQCMVGLVECDVG